MKLNLENKVVLITGATGGIGKACCEEFLKEGCKVALTGRNKEKVDALVKELGYGEDRVYENVADVSKEDEVKAFVDGAYKHFGKIDIIVPNAGYEGNYALLEDVTTENFNYVFGVNVLGVLYMIKYAAPYLKANGHGAVVVTSSNGALLGCAGMGVYCASKHAVQAIVKTAAAELGPHGIHVNSVNPGAVDTDMMRRIERNTFGDTKTKEEAYEIFASSYLDKRYAEAKEVADVIMFLASDYCSHLNAGQIHMDGGMDVSRP